MANLILTLENDISPECPNEWDGWKLVSFNNRHVNSGDVNQYLRFSRDRETLIGADIGIEKKLQVGTAFILDYYEHGLCRWSLQGHGMQCRWDTSSAAGILLWSQPPENLGAKTYNDREKDATYFLEAYTEWCNGEVYYFSLEEVDGADRDSCGGCYGSEGLSSCINESLEDGDAIVQIKGETKWIAEYLDLKVKIKKELWR